MHTESLMRIPLVERMRSDTSVKFVRRALDARWYDTGTLTSSNVGFNPFRSEIYYASVSPFSTWLEDGRHQSARHGNASDRLIKQVLFAVHDYLHIWAAERVRVTCSHLDLGFTPIDSATAEDLAFAHILTESVATVGLDYWYLSTVDLDSLVPIGTCQGPLTVNYNERYIDEYRRFLPELEVQRPSFLDTAARWYCTGVWQGVDANDLKLSPRLNRWLVHEVRYGALQRQYIREWLEALAGRNLFQDRDLAAPIAVTPDRAETIISMSQPLWNLVKNSSSSAARMESRTCVWEASVDRSKPIDFRYKNLARVRESCSDYMISDDSFDMWLDQYIAGLDFERFDFRLVPVLSVLRAKRDRSLVEATLGSQPLVPEPDLAALDLMVLS